MADIPVMPTVEQTMDWVRRERPDLCIEGVRVLCSRVGSAGAPDLLGWLMAEDVLTEDTCRVVGEVWSGAEYPEAVLERRMWRYLFDLAGYTVDSERAERPSEPLRLYRGALPEGRAGWSWTEDPDVAARYAAGSYGRDPGRVWTAVVPPSHLLCRYTEREEFEYVVDTAGLTITEVSTAPEQQPVPDSRTW